MQVHVIDAAVMVPWDLMASFAAFQHCNQRRVQPKGASNCCCLFVSVQKITAFQLTPLSTVIELITRRTSFDLRSSSLVSLSQYHRGGPDGNPECCGLLFWTKRQLDWC